DVFESRHFLLSSDIPPDPDAVTRVARLLLNAKKPGLILGDEVFKLGAQPEALELAETFAMPVFESLLPAFHKFPRRHPLFRGKFAGSDANAGGDCDLLLNLGDYDLGDADVTENIVHVPRKPVYREGVNVVRVSLNTQALARNNPFTEAI